MQREHRREDGEARDSKRRKTCEVGDANVFYFRRPHHLRESAPVRPREVDNIRAGGRRAYDLPRGGNGENIGIPVMSDNDKLAYKVSMVFAILTVIAAWGSAYFILYFNILNNGG